MFDGVLWVPLELVTQHLPRLGSKRFAWIEPLRELRVAGARANVDRVRVERNATGARVRIAITEPLSASAALEGRLLTVSWSEAILPENALALDDPSQMVDSMSVVAREQGAEIRLLLAGKFGDLFVDAGEAPPATVVRLVASANANSGADAAQESGASDSERWMSDEAGTEALEPGVPTIVIDPGHGGLDEGVVGRSGLREKDVALEIAQALRSRLEERMSARVILTREDDESVRPERRTTIANTSDGDLMVSLHCNAASDLEAGGFEAYIYRSEEKPPPRRPVAPVAQESFERDEAAEPDAGGSPTRDAELQLEQWGFVQVPYIERSRRLAEILCKSVDRVGGLSNRGVRSGSVLELAGARMPAVHAEIGFLTNPDDEARLASSEFRAKLADALARGIEAFVRSGDADEASMPHDPEEQAARGDATPPPIAPTAAGTR
jgi:N-acetylmuramoyl-L-alanine amidase